MVAGEPAIYSFKIGALQAYVVHDGVATLPGVQPTFAPEGRASDVKRLLQNAYLPTNHVALSVNVLVLREKSGVTLVDTGAGNQFGPTVGRLPQGLARLGIAPSQVTRIAITHAHGDHVGGLLKSDGTLMYPNATVVVPRVEYDFWMSARPNTSGMNVPAAAQLQTVQTARKFLDAVESEMRHLFVAPDYRNGALSFQSAPGHTPGHCGVAVRSGGESLLVLGDAVHFYALQFPRPEYTMAFDVNPRLAASTRKQLFAQSARNRQRVLGYHLPFPGVGHVRAQKSGYEWVPQPWAI